MELNLKNNRAEQFNSKVSIVNADIAPVNYKSDVEIANELKRNAYLKQLGIDVYETDGLNVEKQLELQSDKNWALSYVLAGKPVPKDMEERLIRAEQERIRRESEKLIQ